MENLNEEGLRLIIESSVVFLETPDMRCSGWFWLSSSCIPSTNAVLRFAPNRLGRLPFLGRSLASGSLSVTVVFLKDMQILREASGLSSR